MKTVLLCEDSDSNRLIVSHMIESLGHHCICARDGLRGWQIMEDNQCINMIVTDLQMPNMDGPTLVQEIRKHAAWKDLPILVYSSFIKISEVASLLERGANAFLNYPVSRSELKEYLERYL